jgi:hypothetical protein
MSEDGIYRNPQGERITEAEWSEAVGHIVDDDAYAATVYALIDENEPLPLQGVCKDCGNGTLNNDLNPAFELVAFDEADGEAGWLCNRCGSDHLDLL